MCIRDSSKSHEHFSNFSAAKNLDELNLNFFLFKARRNWTLSNESVN